MNKWQICKWCFKVTFRVHRGRWFVFRDAPDHFVKLVVSSTDIAKRPGVFRNLWQQAAEEEMLRNRGKPAVQASLQEYIRAVEAYHAYKAQMAR